ncbi:MAG: DUF2785 domain-containing protein, partial [Rubrivivax sp.]
MPDPARRPLRCRPLVALLMGRPTVPPLAWLLGALIAALITALSGAATAAQTPPVAQGCPPAGTSRAELRALAADGWRLPDEARRHTLALALVPCLGEPDPELRDELALGALTAWMRGGALSVATARALGEQVLPLLAAPDPSGFRAPFAALVLAEVARADRLRPLFSPAERHAVVDAATRFERGVHDYRGFDRVQGWRHAVAHGADLLMQLALNPALDRPALDLVLDAVASQATPSTHFYIFGEGERLARPVIFVARRDLHDAGFWSGWCGRIALAGRVEAGAPPSLAALARQHNAKVLLLTLYAALQESGDAT